jgi:hypothetical protein
MSTDTNLTVEDAPDIDIGTSALTLAATVTAAFGSTVAKTFGALTFKKHAGDFAYIVTGTGNTFGAVTQETPDAPDPGTYIYNSVTWPSSASANNVLSYNATGDETNHCFIQGSTPGSPAHLVDSDADGTNTCSNCTIQDMHVG